jgi:glucose/arabinose dehydrogenase
MVAWWGKRGRGARIALISGALILVLLAVGAFTQRSLIMSLLTGTTHVVSTEAGDASLTLPSGFRADVFASGLSAPRFMTVGPDGALLVAERASGSVVALRDPSHTGKATERTTIISGLDQPTSLDYVDGKLYVGESGQITRFNLDATLKASGKKTLIPDLPTGGNHTTRTVLIGSDGKVYVSVGSSCNVCNESDARRAAVLVYQPDGSGGRIFSKGLRNAVGLAVNPWNKQIWATNNGRDLMGDDTPPETVNALKDGADFGWPRCHAGDVIDPDYGKAGACNGVAQPLVKMQAHSAPLGLAFYQSSSFQVNGFPAQYRGLFVAFHGSWNRSVPTGYKVVFIPLDGAGNVSGAPQDFATGWLLSNSSASGRPAGLSVGEDGALYVSDDTGGRVYRITYSG